MTINLNLAAVGKLAEEASDNGLLGGEVIAAIGRIRGAKRLGVDPALLALLVGCGLR